VKGVTSPANAILHPWLKAELSAILATLPDLPHDPLAAAKRAAWRVGQAGLTQPLTVPAERPRLRRLLIWDNLARHATHDLVLWLVRHGIMPLYRPLGGSWLNMTESVQRILKRHALAGQHPQTAEEISTWREATARGETNSRPPLRGVGSGPSGVRANGRGGTWPGAREAARENRCVAVEAGTSTPSIQLSAAAKRRSYHGHGTRAIRELHDPLVQLSRNHERVQITKGRPL
jgi:transposase